uniref:UDP-N-acetylglucosamine 2-epimerase (Non-hydrolyzing) n=1 Tax=candidate division WOR-3 bacterium TaxID=2052148 RepID=A0A7C4U8K4_UNCW3
MKIHLIVGARPNFMKAMPVYNELKSNCNDWDIKLVHTGQHYDYEMSKVFFEVLSLPEPDIFLDVRSGTHGEQTGKLIERIEKVLMEHKPEIVMVFGDVNSTLAGSIAAAKLGIKIAHIEAGLRSFDRTMPEEINRVVTDVLSDYLFVTEKSGIENLKKEGIDERKIFFVGNTMIDTLYKILPKCSEEDLKKFNLKKNDYILVTLHRPSNVDDRDRLEEIMRILEEIGSKKPVIFPVHPRTKKMLKNFNIKTENILLINPLNYKDFLTLERYAFCVITDSGGIQEETTCLNVPCITLRPNTERPITEEIGTNIVLRDRPISDIIKMMDNIYEGRWKKGRIPDLWDGNAAKRIVEILKESFKF